MSRRALTIALGISVALNLFLLGMGAARLWHRSGGPPRAALHAPGGAPWRDGAPPWLDDEHRAQVRERRRALRKARQEVRAALKAKEYDQARLRSGLSSVRTQSLAMQELLHEALAKRAEGLDLEQRRRLASHQGRRSRGPRRSRAGEGRD